VSLIRRPLALLAVVFALGGSAAVEGCGSTSHLVAGVVIHHIANDLARTPGQRRTVNKVFCVYYAHEALQDLRTHHHLTAALAAAGTAHSCTHAFKHL
jgi:hypothetical protein